MANAFSDGRISLWHTSPQSFNLDYVKVKGWGVTDIFLPADVATPAKMTEIKSKVSADGKNFRAQLYVDGTHGQKGSDLAAFTLERITALKPGVVEVDFEGGDDNAIGTAIRAFLTAFRFGDPWRFAFPVCINVVPFKAYVLPLDLMNPDPNCFGRIQTYYGGECRPADPDECRWDWTHRGFPEERLTFMYSAKSRRQIDNILFCDLPIFSDGGVYVRKLRRGAIYNANLLREGGLI
jgi:hypothetical protein